MILHPSKLLGALLSVTVLLAPLAGAQEITLRAANAFPEGTSPSPRAGEVEVGADVPVTANPTT
jgi:hypothetical protein